MLSIKLIQNSETNTMTILQPASSSQMHAANKNTSFPCSSTTALLFPLSALASLNLPSSDVKTVFIAKPVTVLRKPVFYRLPDYVTSRHMSDLWFETKGRPTIGPIVSGIIVTCRSALAISRLLVCFAGAVALMPDAHCTDAEKQRTMAYLSDRG